MTLFGLLSTSQSLFWLSILVLCIVIEIATMGLTTIWFAGGALVAAILAMLSVPFPVQVVSEIDNLEQAGRVTLQGKEWTARTEKNGVKIPVGSVVIVKSIDGVKLIVEERKED